MRQRRLQNAFFIGSLIGSAALITGWALPQPDQAKPDATPMDEIAAVTTSSNSGISAADAAADAGAAAAAWDLPVTRNSHVDGWIDFLKGRNYKLTHRWLERSTRYIPMVQDELKKRDMPLDLIYLAFIESGFNPNAHSHAAAVGLWQFISDTGKRYGLENSEYVDERRDPIKATAGALDYLTELHERFGSWYLAAAAYNTGENRVARVMREYTGSERGTDADFWRIAGALPEETRNYVPLMLAAGHIGKAPADYGFEDLDYQPAFSYATVHVPANVPLAAVAKAVGTTDSIVADLNPELVQQQTPPTRSWDVRVPVGTDKQFAGNFASALHDTRIEQLKHKQVAKSSPKYARSATKSTTGATKYRVKRGDTLSEIAQHYGVTVRQLVRANGGFLPSQLRVGQSINVPHARARA